MQTCDIKQSLETDFDIPFTVLEFVDHGEPAFSMGPKNTGKEFFKIVVSFQNCVRLNMKFVPENYSLPFITSMSHKPDECKLQFLKYAGLLRKMGASFVATVDGEPLDLNDIRSWPHEWQSFSFDVTKMPVPITEDHSSYVELANTWGSVMVGMILSLADIKPNILNSKVSGYAEGERVKILSNRYERNPLNRKLCLVVKGYTCTICGFNFESSYGPLGHHFIHVHHVVPVSKLGADYIIDPVNDLIPVCPNCHAMLHRKDPPFLPNELKKLLLPDSNLK